MKARKFEKTNNLDNASVEAMKAAVIAAGGHKWGDHNDDWIVEFDDGSYYSAAVMNPEYGDAYFNGSARWNPNKVAFATAFRYGRYVPAAMNMAELKELNASFPFQRTALDGNSYPDENRCCLDGVKYVWDGTYQEGAGNYDDYKIFVVEGE